MAGVGRVDDAVKGVDQAGRVIAGLLGYNPGPGIYSRLERAVEAMPENVRVQELPGLLKRYKDGVPGWELKAVDLDSLTAGRDVVPRSEILAAVKERSPVYTHREIVLGGRPQRTYSRRPPGDAFGYERQASPSPLGGGVSHGLHNYSQYSQGGDEYTELLLTQPGADGALFDSHWVATRKRPEMGQAVAHARYDTHGDALRINELQSDLGIHNRRQREIQPAPSGRDAELIAMKDRRESDAMYIERMRDLGHEVARGDDGGWVVVGSQAGRPLPFPLEDAWADILIKRLALEAARKGHRAIEVASPRAIADKVGGNIDNYEHFYGKVVPGALERLGRRMGGMVEDGPVPRSRPPQYELPFEEGHLVTEPGRMADRIFRQDFPVRGPVPAFNVDPTYEYSRLAQIYRLHPDQVGEQATRLHAALTIRLQRAGMAAEEAQAVASRRMPEFMRLAEEQAERSDAYNRVYDLRDEQRKMWRDRGGQSNPPGRRYIMSDEMRKRILTQGIGASLLAPIAMQDE